MRAKKFGGPCFLRHRETERTLFVNELKRLVLVEKKEYGDGRVDRWWEVHFVDISADVRRKVVVATPYYDVAWGMVRPDGWTDRRGRGRRRRW